MDGAGIAAVLVLLVAVTVLRGRRPESRLRAAEGASRVAGSVAVRVGRVLAARRRRRGAARTVGEVVEAWAARLRAGRPVGDALHDAFDDVPTARELLPRTAVSLAVGGDVAAAVRLDTADVPDGAARRSLVAAAACWSVARDNGGRLADALDRLADGVRADQQHVAHVRAQLAGPRASARMLAALPLFALVLGSGLGLSPVAVLLGEPIGRLALAGGVLLDGTGLWWTERMARAAERAA